MAARTPATPKRKGRGGLRILIALVVVIVLVAAGIVTLGVIASADTTVGAVLTTFVPDASVAHSGGSFSSAASGTFVQPGDSVKTDAKGRAQIQFPDGTITRLANNTQIAINSSHFAKDGHVHDISVTDKLGRTLNSVQKLVGGATFQVVGNTTTASVRGTLFEVLVNGDGTVVKVAAMQQVETQTTPGTEQDFTGGLLHNGQVQQFTYAFAAPSAGGSDFKAALAYPGSLMELRITDPANHVYTKTGPSPIVITIPDPPGGIFKLDVIGISGLDPNGEVPFLSVATLEPCATANIELNGAVRHSWTGSDLAGAINVSGLSNVKINIVGDTTGGAIIDGSATYNGIGLAGTLLLYAHSGNIGVIPLAASAFGFSIPPQQAGQQIASALGQDPSNISLGFHVERLFTCQNVLMIEGRTA
ncbi:MAG: FecR domain-containing protein [Chloroflexi bacterium]|nr:MAG: FecR domain-containing protein [Chloroflexota bacterium]